MQRRIRSWGMAQGVAACLLCLVAGDSVRAQRVVSPTTAEPAQASTGTAVVVPVPSTVAAAAPATTTQTATTQTATTAVSKPVVVTVAKSEDANAVLQQQIAKLPPLVGTNVDVAKRSSEILEHLSAVLRFYRGGGGGTPVQRVGEPSDVLYGEQNAAEETQIAQLAFQAAKNEAALLSKISGPTGAAANNATGEANDTPAEQTESQRLTAVRAQVQAQFTTLQTQDAALTQQLAKARGAQIVALQQQQSQVQGQLELQKAMVDALGRINTFSEAQTHTGLAGKIDQLQRSAPELLSTGTKPPAPGVLTSLTGARDSGVTSQAGVLFQLASTLHTIDGLTHDVDQLSQQASDLRTPIIKILRSTVAQGQTLAQAPPPADGTQPADAPTVAETRKKYDQLTATFQVLSAASLPLSQEIVLLQSNRGTLTTWRSAVNAEYKLVLRDLLVRVLMIAIALGFLALLSNLWSRATVRYVSDLRRRRQLLFVRRAVVGFLTGLVLLFGFVTQFSSLATFAGFISAGIAVGLQTILLSVAAYFFIVGRYGVRVGDRITVAGVTGDVIEVGLVRFYMMELTGTGTELHSTGRVAVFANSVLFQTGIPLYKQMPGTEYAWHELTAKLNGNADVPAVTEAILGAVDKVYEEYSKRIEVQHQQVEAWVGTALPAPKIESRLQLAEGGLQFAVLFPVELNNPAASDQQIAEALVSEMKAEGPLKAGVTELPVIKAAVKT